MQGSNHHALKVPNCQLPTFRLHKQMKKNIRKDQRKKGPCINIIKPLAIKPLCHPGIKCWDITAAGCQEIAGRLQAPCTNFRQDCSAMPYIRTLCDIEGSGYPSQQDCAFQGCRRLQQTEWPQRLHARIPGFVGRNQISHWENSNFLGHKSTTTISSFVVPFTIPNWSMSLPSYLQPTGHGLIKLNVIDPFDP